jgi:hypothetical protein
MGRAKGCVEKGALVVGDDEIAGRATLQVADSGRDACKFQYVASTDMQVRVKNGQSGKPRDNLHVSIISNAFLRWPLMLPQAALPSSSRHHIYQVCCK